MSIFVLLHIGKAGLQTELSSDITPLEVFQLFVSDEMIERIVTETNRYAAQSLASRTLQKKRAKKHRLSQWVDTTVHEMKIFFGPLLWMGLVKHEEYWSTAPLLTNHVASNVMGRNRFQLLLSCLHFSDNSTTTSTDRLHKIRNIVDELQTNFQQHYIPGDFFALIPPMYNESYAINLLYQVKRWLSTKP